MSLPRRLFALVARVIYLLAYPVAGLVLHNSHRVRAVVIYKNQLLLQRSSLGSQKWSLPGGGIGKKETPKEAATREVYEETNVQIDPQKIQILGIKRLPIDKRWPQTNITFTCSRLSHKQQPKVTHYLEVIEVAWFSLSDLPENRSSTVDTGLSYLNA